MVLAGKLREARPTIKLIELSFAIIDPPSYLSSTFSRSYSS
jgi:hypothetical protein